MAAKGGGRTRDSPSRTRGDRQGAAETHNEGSEQHMLLFMPDIRRMAEALGTASDGCPWQQRDAQLQWLQGRLRQTAQERLAPSVVHWVPARSQASD